MCLFFSASMLDLRDRFLVPPPPAVELRAFTHGLMPVTVPDRMQQFCEDWAARGVDAWNRVPDRWTSEQQEVGWWSLPEFLGDQFIAPLLGARAGTCIHQPNVHWTIQCLLSCDEPFEGQRSEIILTENEFPSVRHSVHQWKALRNLVIHEVPAGPDGFVDVDAVADAVTDQTAWVFLSHVGFSTGERLTETALKAIARAAHSHGALLAVDGYHATASMPIGVTDFAPDVYVGGLLKEACGSSGNSYLYVRDGLELTPRLSGWFADATPFDFNAIPTPHPSVRRRFLAGTTAVASMYHAVEGVRILFEAGLSAVRADSLEKTAHAIKRADAAGLRLRSPRAAERRGAMVIIEVDHADRLSAWLKGRDIYTDSRRSEVLRLAPFVWNTSAEIDRAFDLIEEAVETGAYLKLDSTGESGPVT